MLRYQSSIVNRQSSDKQNGFTLIELLVAMVIIGIISTIGLTSYINAQIAGRDGRRKQDIRSIATAIILYDQRFGHYPCTGGLGGMRTSAGGGSWITDSCAPNGPIVPNFINELPLDPINTSTHVYRYASVSGTDCHITTDGGGYVLVAVLENANDPDAIDGGGHSFCDGYGASSGDWGANAFIISGD